MIKETRKTVIGGFVVGAVGLGIAAVLVFGSGGFFKQTKTYVLFFHESIKGLNVGAPVLFRGVELGMVTEIRLQANTDDRWVRIPVVIEVDPSRWEFLTNKATPHIPTIQDLIEIGVRASMQMQSMVTGKHLINLDFYPNEPARLIGSDLPYEEIPTIQTRMDKLSETLEKLPLQKIVEDLASTIAGIDDIINSKEAKAIVPDVHDLMSDVRRIIQNLDGQIDPLVSSYNSLAQNADRNISKVSADMGSAVNAYKNLATNVDKQMGSLILDYRKLARDVAKEVSPLMMEIQKTSESLRNSAAVTDATLKTAQAFLSHDSPVLIELEKTLKELSSAARSIRVWADYLERHPEALIQGKGSYRR